MHHHKANTIGICKGLEPGNDLVIVGVAVSVSTDFPDFLQRVYDDQRGVLVFPKEPGELFVQAASELFCRNREE